MEVFQNVILRNNSMPIWAKINMTSWNMTIWTEINMTIWTEIRLKIYKFQNFTSILLKQIHIQYKVIRGIR